jgi:predicted transcriptional regulator
VKRGRDVPGSKQNELTPAEQRIMEVVWARGTATVGEVRDLLASSAKPLAFNTVQTMLRILEKKGFVRHREEGRAFRYLAVVDRSKASRRAVNSLVSRFFASPGALAVSVLKTESLTSGEIAEIKAIISHKKGR